MESAESHNATLARLLGALPDTVIILDSLGRLKWGNHAAERMFNRSIEDSIDLEALDLVHPDDLEMVLRSLASVMGKETGTLIEVRVNTASGWRLLEVIGSPVEWRDDKAVLFCLRDLTERRRFELARNQEARLRSLVHNAADIMILVSPTGSIESVSGALSRMLGHDPELVENCPLAELVTEDDRPILSAAFERASLGSNAAHPVTTSVRLLRYGSTATVPFELTLVNLLDDPTVGGFVVSAHDITSRTAMDLELRRTVSLLTATLDATADGVLAVDTSGQITNFNRRFAEMWQLPKSILAQSDVDATISFVLDQLVRPDEFRAKLGEAYANPDAETMDMLEFKDGRVFERHSRPQRIDDEVVGRVWSFSDVTERKRIEEELRESEQRFRRAFKQGPLGVALVDLSLHITNVNGALCRLVGRTRQELLGATFESFTHSEDVTKEAELVRQMSEGAIPRFQTETRFVTKDGSVVFGSVTASIVRSELGEPTHGLRIVEDITERKQLERELAERAQAAGAILASLTATEKEILKLLGDTETAPKMARQLTVSVGTVETHLADAYRKLGVRTRDDAVAEFARLTRAVTAPQEDVAAQL
jgi:PAS domain S-box-containing protein